MVKKSTCPICNELFDIPPTNPRQKYCSRDCSVIGRRSNKEDEAKKRVDRFIDTLLDIEILDVLDGMLAPCTTNNRMTVKGARMWEGEEFVVLVVKRKNG